MSLLPSFHDIWHLSLVPNCGQNKLVESVDIISTRSNRTCLIRSQQHEQTEWLLAKFAARYQMRRELSVKKYNRAPCGRVTEVL